MKIAVLSDLHFGSSANARASEYTYVIAGAEKVSRQHPVDDLIELINRDKLRADVVVCPGDITLMSDRVGLNEAWATLNRLTTELSASHLLTATGNHDILSRFESGKLDESPEIWERLKQLEPSYPYPQADRIKTLEYWAEHFFSVEVGGVRFLVLNTCNTHSRGESEYRSGRITDYTIQQVRKLIESDSSPILNVLVCHHHPIKYAEISQFDADYSEMIQGRALLQMLEDTGQHWIVMHGHKHSPRIEYSPGGSGDAPVLFSAGSFSAVLSPRYFPNGRNQFYIIDIDLNYVRANGVAGIVDAWDWTRGLGWFVSTKSSRGRIPSGAGFGHRFNMKDARDINAHFASRGKIPWNEVVKEFEFVSYLTPNDAAKLIKILKEKHGLDAKWSSDRIFPDELLR